MSGTAVMKRSTQIVEQRRSNAAGTHRKRRKDRRNALRKAVAQSKADG